MSSCWYMGSLGRYCGWLRRRRVLRMLSTSYSGSEVGDEGDSKGSCDVVGRLMSSGWGRGNRELLW